MFSIWHATYRAEAGILENTEAMNIKHSENHFLFLFLPAAVQK